MSEIFRFKPHNSEETKMNKVIKPVMMGSSSKRATSGDEENRPIVQKPTMDSFKSKLLGMSQPSSWNGFSSTSERLKIDEGDITIVDGPDGKMMKISERVEKQLWKPWERRIPAKNTGNIQKEILADKIVDSNGSKAGQLKKVAVQASGKSKGSRFMVLADDADANEAVIEHVGTKTTQNNLGKNKEVLTKISNTLNKNLRNDNQGKKASISLTRVKANKKAVVIKVGNSGERNLDVNETRTGRVKVKKSTKNTQNGVEEINVDGFSGGLRLLWKPTRVSVGVVASSRGLFGVIYIK
ncbi:hypothetical protein ACOSQ3_003888 [Xanthoceras sorbifolium]